MAPNRIMQRGAVRRALLVAVAGLALASAFGACGGGNGKTTTAVPDQDLDAEILNRVLTRQLAAVDAYDRSLRALGGPELALARRLRAQEQEHIDAIVKALRGLGAEAEPEEEEIEVDRLKTEADHLVFLYEVENATIDDELNAVTQLTGGWPRGLLATIVANQAEHLVLLRRALGVKPLETIPSAFEDGTVPAP